MSKPDLPFTTSPHVDTGPLSWVMVEIREALARSRTALFEAGGRDPEDQTTALQHAKSHLHQAHGALQMVDVEGVALLTQLAEVVLDRFRDGTLKCTPDHAQVLANMYQALVEFLEELLAGAPFQPVRLFPYFRDVQDLLGIDRVHPADLFFPDVSQVPELPATPGSSGAPNYKALRQRFERALLPYLKAADAASQSIHAAALQAAITDVAEQQQQPKARAFWRSMQAFAELAVGGQLASSKYVKQIFGLINLQLRRLSEGNSELPDSLLRQALFFIATADKTSLPPLAQQLRTAYALDSMVPADFETLRYGQVDEDALVRAKEGVAQARSVWHRLEAAEGSAPLTAEFTQAVEVIREASHTLGLRALATLMQQLGEVAQQAQAKGRSEELGLEMATALLFAEHGVEQIRHLPDDFNAHADTIGARLQALAAGGSAPQPAQWQGSLARQLHEDDTVVALSQEMKACLRHVEKSLDEYYNDPAKRSELGALDKGLHQLHGALAMLDQDHAMRAAEHVRKEIHKLANGLDDPAHEAKHLDEIAQNVGALGFFVDMLSQNQEGARERYAFDEEHGTFRAVPFKKIAGPESIPVLDEPLPEPEAAEAAPSAPVPEAAPGSDGDAEIEAELLEIFIGEAQEVLAFVGETLARPHAEINNADHMTQLRRSYHTLKGSSRMVGLMQFGDAAHAIEKVMNVWLAEERAATPALFDLLTYATTELTAWVEQLVSTGSSHRTSAALTAAAARVQEGGAFEAPAAVEAPAPVEAVATEPVPEPVAQAIAEPVAEPTIEPATELMLEPVGEAAAEPAAAEPVEESIELSLDALPAEPEEIVLDAMPEETIEAIALGDFDDMEPPAKAAEEEGATEELVQGDEPSAELEPLLEELLDVPSLPHNVIEFPTATAPAAPVPAPEDNVKFVGRLAIPLPLYNIYLTETDELVRLLTQDFSEWRHEARRPVNPDALQAAHTLTGTSGTVGFKNLRELAYALETTLLELQSPGHALDDAQHDLFDFTIERVRQMLASFAAGEMPDEQPELIEALHKLCDELSHPRADTELDARLDSIMGADELATRLDNLFTDTYHSLVENPPPAPPRAEKPAPQLASQDDDIDNLFGSAFEDAIDAPTLEQIAEPEPVAEAEPVIEAEPVAEAEPELVAEAVAEAEPEPEIVAEPVLELVAEPEIPELVDAIDATAAANEADIAEAVAEPAPEPVPEPAIFEDAVDIDHAPPGEVEVIALEESPHLLGVTPSDIDDELDADLLPVFLEEGTDLLPQIGESLRAWHAAPSDFSHAHALQRVLHTVKGSARMAGAMRLGQHAHEIETHIENMVHANLATPHAFDELMAHYDHALLLFEQLQNPAAAAEAAAAMQAAAQGSAPADGAPRAPSAAAALAASLAMPAARPVAGGAGTAAPAAPVRDEVDASKSPLVRVRADILDRMVNQAGEVSITRSRLENEIGSLRTSLADFQENLARLNRQLREVEMQAESQIASRMSIAGEREFDPLEFDRFTRLQELTRMMAESVNDVESFHESLIRSVDGASGDLTQQARMTRDLQRDLMRVRMVPFASISERLFRVARQSAKETDKRVNLDIRGGGVEMDRSVLERMSAPFEHLLRNAIVHGVEKRADRTAHGKNETGELLVSVTQQGNEVVLEFSDDGAGLDLDRIRAKARSVGLLAEGQEISDADASNLIFQPGFSTADSLTELAGRGVGMDIVLSEAQSLGGRVDTYSEQGKGARFTIRLPLTLAVTQVVLVNAGGRTFAVPSLMVEQVLQMKQHALHEATEKGAVVHHGQHVGLRYLPLLLGDTKARPIEQRSAPVMMLKNGNDRTAIHVDEIIGNREVVIKNIGPQLSRMPGIAGATVLGSGEIVLILNPVALQLHVAAHPELLPKAAPVVTESTITEVRQATGVIMVVDDSLTVRKVTQRLLEREGYQVMLAKDGVDALEQMQDRLPELMLVDIEMPRMDGFDLTRNVRGVDGTKHIPIIMITSRSADKHRNYALQLGVNAYFGKPFQEEILLGAIAGLLPKRA